MKMNGFLPLMPLYTKTHLQNVHCPCITWLIRVVFTHTYNSNCQTTLFFIRLVIVLISIGRTLTQQSEFKHFAACIVFNLSSFFGVYSSRLL